MRIAGPGLLVGLARRAFLERLAVLKIAGRQGPEAAPRLDGAAAEQHTLTLGQHGANDDLRIAVRDKTARVRKRRAAGCRPQAQAD